MDELLPKLKVEVKEEKVIHCASLKTNGAICDRVATHEFKDSRGTAFYCPIHMRMWSRWAVSTDRPTITPMHTSTHPVVKVKFEDMMDIRLRLDKAEKDNAQMKAWLQNMMEFECFRSVVYTIGEGKGKVSLFTLDKTLDSLAAAAANAVVPPAEAAGAAVR